MNQMRAARIRQKLPFLVKALAGAAIPLVILDGRIFTRTMLGSREMANVAYVGLFSAAIVCLVLLAFRSQKSVSAIVGLGIFLASLARLEYATVSFNISIQVVIGYLGLISTILVLNYTKRLDLVERAIALGLIVNAVVLFEPTGILRTTVINNTAYSYLARAEVGYSAEEAVSFTRSVGVYNSPGFLATMASVALGLYITLTLEAPSLLRVALSGLAVVTGVMSGNRSFIAVIILVACYFAWITMRARRFAVAAAGLLLFAICISFAFVRGDLLSTEIAERLSPEVLIQDLDARTQGGAGVMPAVRIFLRNPLLGAYARDEYADGSECVQDEFETVRPHMSIAQIFASRGAFVGIAFVWLVVRGVRGFRMGINSEVLSKKDRLLARAMLNGFVLAAAICLSEPLLEFGPVLVALGVGLHLADQKRLLVRREYQS